MPTLRPDSLISLCRDAASTLSSWVVTNGRQHPTATTNASPAGRAAFWAGLIIGIAVILAYANSLQGAFVYDDIDAIAQNATLQPWWRLDHVLVPPPNTTVSGRPLLNLTLAVNHAISGTGVWSYHVGNTLIHLVATLVLFGLVRRTLALDRAPSLGAGPGLIAPRVQPEDYRPHALSIASAVALLWGLHPLVTEAVDYVVQRAESLMSLFLLLTLYCFVRSVESDRSEGAADAAAAVAKARRWRRASVICCALGMATKENMAAAPVLVLLYDRAFVSGTLRAAWNRRPGYYSGLAATWLLVAALVLSTGGNRSGTVGFGTTVSALQYWWTQPRALVRYAALAVWPSPLVFDYGTPWAHRFAEVAWRLLIVAAIVAATLRGLWRNRPSGFLAGAALALLAPTSLMPGISQMIVEHRMYLPLASVVILGIAGAWRLHGARTLGWCAVAATALLSMTIFRNATYRTEISLWADAAAKCPDNARAYFNVGNGLHTEGHFEQAITLYRKAIALYPDYLEARNNLGNALCQVGRPDEALPEYEAALRQAPSSAGAQNNVGNALYALGRPADAIPHYERALQLKANYWDAELNLGAALVQVGRAADAIPCFERAVALQPEKPDAYAGLANALAHAGKLPASFPMFDAALRRDPRNAEVRAMYGNALADANRLDDALAQFEVAAKLQPNSATLQYNYAATLLSAGRTTEAVQRFEAALQLQPDFAPARNALAQIRAQRGGR